MNLQENISRIKEVMGLLSYGTICEDKIPGGLAQGKSLEDIAKHHDKKGYYDLRDMVSSLKNQLNKGIKAEMEHTTDKSIAKEIAMDHLWEHPNYYDKLLAIENNQKVNEHKDRSQVIENLLNQSLVNANKDIICGIKVTHPKNRGVLDGQPKYLHYKLDIFFLHTRRNKYFEYLHESLMNEAWRYVNDFMGISIDVYSRNVSTCDNWERVWSTDTPIFSKVN